MRRAGLALVLAACASGKTSSAATVDAGPIDPWATGIPVCDQFYRATVKDLVTDDELFDENMRSLMVEKLKIEAAKTRVRATIPDQARREVDECTRGLEVLKLGEQSSAPPRH